MEKIQSHEIKDIWRVRDGLLIEISKFQSLGYFISDNQMKTKIIRGCKGLRELKEDYTNQWSKKTYPKGTLLLHGAPVEPITDVNKFKAEIKSSGGSVLGSITEIHSVLNDIKTILLKYE
ncbi:hypothetical protein P9294_gp003 [Bacillus phage FADO]|uniref:Uncharacterized protein n=1 Tax=Bacillus phage FADO TaxID=2917160 RepID=A0AAE9G5M8_9CAUD|nr:hypothetical protein P9294_gp003 [Bacillus phage FADO]UNY48718.1 hypothetical protein fado_3 [Bacillus phage FADO]